MIIDGNAIAEDILDTLKCKISQKHKDVSLCVFVVGSDYATEKFLSIKKKKAEEIGVRVNVTRFPSAITTKDLILRIQERINEHAVDGVIVQLPLPKHIDTYSVLESIPVEKDIDVLSSKSRKAFKDNVLDIIPPVIGGIKEIIDRTEVSLIGKHAVVIGRGALVGEPAVVWLERQGVTVDVLDKSTSNFRDCVKEADIIISGAGVPGLIKPNMIKEDVMLFDAGTSESDGKLAGDAEKECLDKCKVFTPTPGGIGPITVAVLLQNLVSRAL
jgi:methylenetetrahydrofolate dehydrogenase (NADP+)/methenyltetrahydrofolate cyclohydrolase